MTTNERSRTGPGECRRYRPLLLSTVEELVANSSAAAVGRVGQAAGPGASEHLERCLECRGTVADTALALIRLQRWVQDSTQAESPADAWVRLRTRVEASRRHVRETAWRARASLAGLITSTLLVGVIVGRIGIFGTAPGFLPASEPTGPPSGARFVLPVEMRYIQQAQQATISQSAPTREGAASGQRLIPDGTRPETKEVSPPELTGPGRGVS